MVVGVRAARVDEAELVRDLHDAAIRGLCQGEYSSEEIAAWASPKPISGYARDIERHVFLIAEQEGRIAGFGALSRAKAEVLAVYVAPERARRGVGSALLRELERAARAHGLAELGLSSSLTAEPFYRAHGYDAVGRCVHRTAERELLCVRMRKSLS